MPRSLLAVVLLAQLAPAASASCAQSQLVPEILTTRVTHLPADGGVLVGYSSTMNDAEPSSGDPSNATKWTATAGTKTIALTRVSLAPGLSVYRPPATTDAFAIADSKGVTIGTFTHDTTAGAATAMKGPATKSVTVETAKGRRWTTTTATLELRTAPPAEAVAAIVYRVDGGKLEAVSFGRLPDTHDKLTSVE